MSQEPGAGGVFMWRMMAIALAALIVLLGALYWAGIVPNGKKTPADSVQQPMADSGSQVPLDAGHPGAMKLEAQYAGPFQGTLIQRWRDPIDGRVCYLYIPVIAKHGPADQNGLLDYGPNSIGSISCTGPGPGGGGGGNR